MKITDLKDIANGALMENAKAAIEQVVRNMVDVNTPYKNKRQVIIKLTFEQTEDREDAQCTIDVSTKLAPVKPLKTSFNFGRDLTTGEIFVEEYGNQIKGQMSINDIQKNEEDNNTENTVIDYRKVKKA